MPFGDQIGDGTEGKRLRHYSMDTFPLPALKNGVPAPKLPTAMVAASYGKDNESEDVDSRGGLLRLACFYTTNPYAEMYTTKTYSQIFDNKANDAVVPVISARDGQDEHILLENVVHGPGSVGKGTKEDPHLGFKGPDLLANQSGAPMKVVELLNSEIDDSRFVLLPRD